MEKGFKQPNIQMEKKEKEESFNFSELLKEKMSSQVKKAIETPADLASFENWRKLDQQGKEARQLRKITELLTAAKAIITEHPDKKEETGQDLLELLNLKGDISARSRLDQFQAVLAAESLGLEEPAVQTEVDRLTKGLEKLKSTEGELNSIELLSSSHVDFNTKREWIEAHFLPRALFLAKQDLAEAKEIPPRPEKPPEISELPPEEQDFVKPSIDEMEKKEGEPEGYFTVKPFYGGYWKEGAFSRWDSKNLCFRAGAKKMAEAEEVKIDADSERAMRGIIKGGARTPLPCAYNFAFQPETLKFPPGAKVEIRQDKPGDYLLEAKAEGIIPFSISLGKRKKAAAGKEETPQIQEIKTGQLTKETEKVLAELLAENITSLEKARKLKQYVRGLLEYPDKGDSSYNAVYYKKPRNFFSEIERHKKADCDVANSFFIALLSRLKIPARLAVGHYIKVKDHQGQAVFSSGSRHAWTEVWDPAAGSGQVSGWHRLDATPSGAPELDEQEMDEKEEDEELEGDFGETEAEIISDEELEKMIAEIKELQKNEKAKKKSPEEIRNLNFAREAECTPEEARIILAEMERARQLKDAQGRNIIDLLSREFMKIIKENLREVPSYRAPVRLPEADELEEPVEAYIDIKTGEAEPGGFKKYEKKIEKVQEYGGFDVILISDKSYSMRESDPVSGQEKWREQQKFVFLTIEALHKFSNYCRRQRIKLLNPIDVRTALITFQAGKGEPVLPLTDSWGPKEQYTVWKNLQENIGGGTPDHLGLQAAQEMILKDREKQKGRRKEELKKRLRLVIVTADGGSNDKGLVQSTLQELRQNDMVIEGVGLTEAAKEIEATYYPNGQCLKSVREAPAWAAQRIIKQAQKLYPKKVKNKM